MDDRIQIAFKVLGVFLCLYIFLVGISGLSKSISGLTAPEHLAAGDMAQLKKITLEEENITKKKVWVKIISVEDDGRYGFEYKETKDSLPIKGYTIKKNIKKVASANFISATNSAFICLFIGVFATVLFQSSSTTTSLIVGMAG